MRLAKQSRLRVEPLEDRCVPSSDLVLEWNQRAVAAVGQARMNPVAGSRAIAITQAAVYDAVVAIEGSFEPYHAHIAASSGASPEAAAAQAARDALAALFPAQVATFDAALAADLAAIPPGQARQGIAVGQEAARQILALRSTDGSGATVTYTPGTDPGDWQRTPPGFLAPLAPHWANVTPWAMSAGSQFRPAAPPALDSAAYAADFNEVKDLGRADSPTRTAEQTQIARFWNDGLGTAFAYGYWNKIAQQVATDERLSLVEDARLFALLNIATADALIATWDAKFAYNLWRPVTAIRAAAAGAEPDASWTPLLVTPNFPSYTSAHSTVSGAAAGVLTALFGADRDFSVVSEGSLPGVSRSFTSFDAAAQEAGQSRVYGGIHFFFDSTAGLTAGAQLADHVLDNFLTPQDHDDLTAAAAAPRTVHQSLRPGQVQPLLAQALARWEAAGIDTSALGRIDVRIADLGGLTLGRADDGVIWVDDNAAGWGWFVDRSPRTDGEFTRRGNQGEKNRMDLLTALEHEVGHLLGYDHAAGGVMRETLEAGVRRTMGPATLTAADRPGAAPSLFVWAGDTPWVIDGLVTGKRR